MKDIIESPETESTHISRGFNADTIPFPVTPPIEYIISDDDEVDPFASVSPFCGTDVVLYPATTSDKSLPPGVMFS